MEKFFRFIVENLTHVAPILLTGGIGLVIIIERTKALIWTYQLSYSDAFFDKIKLLVMSDRINDAIGMCVHIGSKPFVQVIREGLMRAHQPESVIEDGLRIVVGKVTEEISSRTPYLATIANVATLFGLFGTIVGLVQSYKAVGTANPQERAGLLAAGISTAMNATMMGLGVAIPCMIAFSILTARSNKLTAEVDRAAVCMLDLLKQRYYSSGNEDKPAKRSRA